MRTFIFGIGGTGVRVMRSLSMLLASGAHSTGPDNLIVPILIDYDLGNYDTDLACKILSSYESINKSVYTTLIDKELNGHFFSSPVKKLKDFEDGDVNISINPNADYKLYLTEADTNKTYAEHIGFDKLSESAGLSETQNLLRILYDDAPGTESYAELELNLDKGFKGCPNIGCVVTKCLTESRELKKFMSMVNSTDRVIIVGSIFGGTGASGIPMLLDLIKGTTKTANIPVAVIAVTPYFNVDSDNKSAIDSDTFTAKAKSALDAYDLGTSVNRQATFIYYIGDNYKKGTFANSEGGITQKNPAHVVELIAATMALDFMSVDFNDGNNTKYIPVKNVAKPFEMGMTELANIDDVDDKLGISRFFDVTRERYLYPIARFIIFAKFFENFIYAEKQKKNDTGIVNSGVTKDTDFKNELHNFIGYFYEWIDEIQDGSTKRALNLFNSPDAADYDNLYVNIKTCDHGFLNMKSNFISEQNIRDRLNKIWDKRKEDKGLNEPRRYFIDAMDEITKDEFANILKNQ